MIEEARKFGPFAPAFEGFPAYLQLLNLNGGTEPLALIAKCCRTTQDPEPYIAALLTDLDWRSHLIGGAALCFLAFRADSFANLWRAFDTGSWVSPQLAAIASVRDPGFVTLARHRLQSLCPVIDVGSYEVKAPEWHVVRGPAGNAQRSAKAAASLVQLLKMQDQPAFWLANMLSSPELSQLLRQDIDRSDEIAAHWVTNLKAQLHALDEYRQ